MGAIFPIAASRLLYIDKYRKYLDNITCISNRGLEMFVKGFSWMAVCMMLLGGSYMIFAVGSEAEAYVTERTTDYMMNATEPAVDGDHLVFSGTVKDGGKRVFLRNTRTDIEFPVCSFESHEPDISGDNVVFWGYQDSNPDLFLYTISTGSLRRLTNDAGWEWHARIDGPDLVYNENRGGSYEVVHLDLVSMSETVLASTSDSEMHPSVHDRMVVFDAYRAGRRVLMGHDLRTGTGMEILNFSGLNAYDPDIFGDRVVFKDQSSGLILLLNLTTSSLNTISDPNALSYYPRIYMNTVVFSSDTGAGGDIRIFDISTGTSHSLTDDFFNDRIAVVWGEHVYFTRLMSSPIVCHILLDQDDDGIPDQKDMFPYDPNEHFDFDGDGWGDFKDFDDDNDGFEDSVDSFPRDPDEWYDFDGDGIGDNQDPDDDNDGLEDTVDADPRDPNTPIMEMLHRIMIRLDVLENNLTSRLEDLSDELAALAEVDPESVLEMVNNSLIDLETALSNINLTLVDGVDGILGSMGSLHDDLTNLGDGTMFEPESFFDVFTEVVINTTESIFDLLINLSLRMNATQEDMNSTREAFRTLDLIDDMVSDLESIGKNVESQSAEIENNGNDIGSYFVLMIVIFSVWSLIVLAFVFFRTRNAEDVATFDD